MLFRSAPFVGLFGTCKGIITAFSDISTQGMGGPSVIAAGISEALVSTATGLLVGPNPQGATLAGLCQAAGFRIG